MRLGCPGCGAQYEVGAGAIPDAGREVKCSACGHTWFQSAEAPLVLTPPPAPAAPAIPPVPDDFRALLREEAARETAKRRDEGVPPPVPHKRRRGGFMTGMLLALIPLAVLAGLYAGAPRLEREAPALAGPLDDYVRQVDALRLKLDGWAQQVRAPR